MRWIGYAVLVGDDLSAPWRPTPSAACLAKMKVASMRSVSISIRLRAWLPGGQDTPPEAFERTFALCCARCSPVQCAQWPRVGR